MYRIGQTKAEEAGKKAWSRPELEILDVKKTEYWAYEINPDTGFWQQVWINES